MESTELLKKLKVQTEVAQAKKQIAVCKERLDNRLQMRLLRAECDRVLRGGL